MDRMDQTNGLAETNKLQENHVVFPLKKTSWVLIPAVQCCAEHAPNAKKMVNE